MSFTAQINGSIDGDDAERVERAILDVVRKAADDVAELLSARDRKNLRFGFTGEYVVRPLEPVAGRK